MKNLTNKELKAFYEAAKLCSNVSYQDQWQESCSFIAAVDSQLLDFYKWHLARHPEYMGLAWETGMANFSEKDGFGDLNHFQRQLARSLMLLLVMEANK